MSAQIDLLHPDARRVLRYCAVLGRSFRVEVLRRTLATDGLVADAATLSSLELVPPARRPRPVAVPQQPDPRRRIRGPGLQDPQPPAPRRRRDPGGDEHRPRRRLPDAGAALLAGRGCRTDVEVRAEGRRGGPAGVRERRCGRAVRARARGQPAGPWRDRRRPGRTVGRSWATSGSSRASWMGLSTPIGGRQPSPTTPLLRPEILHGTSSRSPTSCSGPLPSALRATESGTTPPRQVPGSLTGSDGREPGPPYVHAPLASGQAARGRTWARRAVAAARETQDLPTLADSLMLLGNHRAQLGEPGAEDWDARGSPGDPDRTGGPPPGISGWRIWNPRVLRRALGRGSAVVCHGPSSRLRLRATTSAPQRRI